MNNYIIINYDKNHRYGIYKITNTINGKVYIGQSINIRARIWQHVNYEANVHLKNSFDKYGIENFQFEVIKITKNLDYWENFLFIGIVRLIQSTDIILQKVEIPIRLKIKK